MRLPDPPPTHATPVLAMTRVGLGAVLAVIVPIGTMLFFLPTRTDELFAWTIAVPLTAAFLGACYLGSCASVALAMIARTWQTARLMVVLAIVTIGLLVLVTFLHLDEFHLGEGTAFSRTVAWIWLVTYVAGPPTFLTWFIVQERAGGSREYAVARPLRPWFRVALALDAAVAGTVAVALLVAPDAVGDIWAWPVTPLAARAIAAFLAGIAAGSAWILRDGDWGRARLGVLAHVSALSLVLVAVLRFSDDLAGGARTWGFVVATALSLAAYAVAAWAHEREARTPAATTPQST